MDNKADKIFFINLPLYLTENFFSMNKQGDFVKNYKLKSFCILFPVLKASSSHHCARYPFSFLLAEQYVFFASSDFFANSIYSGAILDLSG